MAQRNSPPPPFSFDTDPRFSAYSADPPAFPQPTYSLAPLALHHLPPLPHNSPHYPQRWLLLSYSEGSTWINFLWRNRKVEAKDHQSTSTRKPALCNKETVE
ncbi:unnamed protein product [Boreogadus saida]